MSETWTRIGDSLEDFAPRLVAAVAILLAGWIAAWLVSTAVKKFLHRTSIDNRIGQWVGASETSTESAVANLTFWTIMLLVLVAALEALAFEAVTRPLNDMVSDVLGFLPNLLAAVLIMVIGYVIARIVRVVAANFAAAAGVDRIGQRAGLTQSNTATPIPSEVIGLVAFALVLIPTLVAALSALNLPEVARPASNMLDQILAALPDILAASLVLVIAFLIGRVVQQLATSILAGTGLDGLPARLGGQPDRGVGGLTSTPPSQMAGVLLFAAVMVTAAMEAARLVGFVSLALLIEEFLLFAGNILMGLVIVAIGFWLASIVARAIRSSRVEPADLLARLAQVAVIFLAVSIGLGEMGIGREIVILAFALPLGALAVGAAVGLGVAFGLGGQAVASRLADRVASAIDDPERSST